MSCTTLSTLHISFDLTSNPMCIIIPNAQMRKLKPTDPDDLGQDHNEKWQNHNQNPSLADLKTAVRVNNFFP